MRNGARSVIWLACVLVVRMTQDAIPEAHTHQAQEAHEGPELSFFSLKLVIDYELSVQSPYERYEMVFVSGPLGCWLHSLRR